MARAATFEESAFLSLKGRVVGACARLASVVVRKHHHRVVGQAYLLKALEDLPHVVIERDDQAGVVFAFLLVDVLEALQVFLLWLEGAVG